MGVRVGGPSWSFRRRASRLPIRYSRRCLVFLFIIFTCRLSLLLLAIISPPNYPLSCSHPLDILLTYTNNKINLVVRESRQGLPFTLSPEYVAAQRAYMRYHNMNPIFGISSKWVVVYYFHWQYCSEHIIYILFPCDRRLVQIPELRINSQPLLIYPSMFAGRHVPPMKLIKYRCLVV